MDTQKNALSLQKNYAQASTPKTAIDTAIDDFLSYYNARADYFTDKFISRVNEGNRKALAELAKHRLPPTPMDLREPFEKCLAAGVSDDHAISLSGKKYSVLQLRHLVPLWASIAERALIDSDPALADKLMTREQWNARVAFEVTFVSAMTELDTIVKTGKANTFESYLRWTIMPLQKALENVKAVNTPRNTLVGYVTRVPLSKAIMMAETIELEFQRLIQAAPRT